MHSNSISVNPGFFRILISPSLITIEQTNNNTISSSMDLDGIVSGLDDALGEAIEIMTEGVHV